MPANRSAAAPGTASPVPERQCSRCRAVFAGDPTLLHHPDGPPQWWLCPPCQSTLFRKGA